MIRRPFLTDLDSRAAIKGSRDPLGIQPIWTRFGRHFVGNLSTVSVSVRDFTVLLLGYYFAEHVAEREGAGTELATFLKWEQLAAYSRAKVNGDWEFRGTERVRRNLDEGTTVTLSAAVADQILSSQKLYGIWGLYSMPARASGLLDGDPAKLTPLAREIVEQFYLFELTKAGFRDGKQILEMLSIGRIRLDTVGAHRSLLKTVAGLFRWRFTSREREFYREHLLYGGPDDSTEGRQRKLADLLIPKLSASDFPWTSAAVIGLAKEAASHGKEWHSLAFRLRRIAATETILAPASALFAYLLGSDDAPLTSVVKRLTESWGKHLTTVAVSALGDLKAELGSGDADTGERWSQIGEAMSEGDYLKLVRLLLQQNRVVMQSRGSAAAWIEEQNGRLKVRMAEERGSLPQKEDLRDLWRFSYFLNSLCSIGFALEEKA
jgi:hypothetical protein